MSFVLLENKMKWQRKISNDFHFQRFDGTRTAQKRKKEMKRTSRHKKEEEKNNQQNPAKPI